MPITNVKLNAPTYDSDRDIPPFAEYHDMFLNFVDYQEHGRSLITLAMHALGRTFNTNISFTREDMDGSLLLGDEELAALEQNLATEENERAIKAYADLTSDEQKLDRNLYSILAQCVRGKSRVIIANVQFRSFVQAWVRLVQKLGANNIQRKTDLIIDLQKLQFNRGDIAAFKTHATRLITDLYNNHVTLEDIMLHSIVSALPTELMALKVVQADKLNDNAKTSQDVFSFIETTSTTLEIAGMGKKSNRDAHVLTTKGAGTCERCGRNGHHKDDCYARRHADGSEIAGRAPKEPPPRKPRHKGRVNMIRATQHVDDVEKYLVNADLE